MVFSHHMDYEKFERHVRFERRYVRSTETEGFLTALKSTLSERIRPLPKDSILYRSQVGYDEHLTEGGPQISGFSVNRMTPNREFCGEGRANPKGIPYLYLANDEKTSMAELRPHIGEMISVAEFQTQRDLKLVDCFSDRREFGNLELIFNPPTSQEEIADAIWSKINRAFSRPVSRSDLHTDYIATQILSEWFCDQGFDGICFKSGLAAGYNFALFNLNSAELVSCSVFNVDALKYEFSECANRYFRRLSNDSEG